MECISLNMHVKTILKVCRRKIRRFYTILVGELSRRLGSSFVLFCFVYIARGSSAQTKRRPNNSSGAKNRSIVFDRTRLFRARAICIVSSRVRSAPGARAASAHPVSPASFPDPLRELTFQGRCHQPPQTTHKYRAPRRRRASA